MLHKRKKNTEYNSLPQSILVAVVKLRHHVNALFPTVVDVWVDFSDRDNVSQHVTQPLRVQEIQVTQQRSIIMQ